MLANQNFTFLLLELCNTIPFDVLKFTAFIGMQRHISHLLIVLWTPSGLGSSPGWGHHIEFLSKTLTCTLMVSLYVHVYIKRVLVIAPLFITGE